MRSSTSRVPTPANPLNKPQNSPASRKSFLADVVINHGPADVLSRLFLVADTELRRRGLHMSFTTFEELLEINQANSDSWHPLVSVFDPRVGGANSENGFVLIGTNPSGKVVSAFAARHYPLQTCSLKEEIESLRLFYADPERSRQPGEHIVVTAPTAAATRNGAVYIGGVWFHPECRGQKLHRVMSPITRALSFTRWGAEIAFSLMVQENVDTGVARSARFPHVEWGATWTNSPVFGDGTLELALVWTSAEEQLSHFAEYVASAQPRNEASASAPAAREQSTK